MKIIHTADWHLGQNFFGYDRTEEHQCFLDWLIREITDRQVDVLLISGDVFDVANPSAQALHQFYSFLHIISRQNPGLQIIIIAGNHDSATRLETPAPLLEDLNVHIRGRVRRTDDGAIDTGHLIIPLKSRKGKEQAWCMAVPYLRQGDYPSPENKETSYRDGIRNLYGLLLKSVICRRNPGEAIIAMGHLQVVGALLSDDDLSERLIIGGIEGIPADIFSSDITYGALGHIHREQRVGGKENIRYAGSPLAMSFAEENYHHGVILLELNKENIIHQEKLPFQPLHPLLKIPKEPQPLEQVLPLLEQLPEKDALSPAPYLEVRILLDEPRPALRSVIEDAVNQKNVRLTRIVPFYPEQVPGNTGNSFLSTEELMDPWKIMNLEYEKRFRAPLPEELARIFKEATEEAQMKLGEKQ